MIILHTQKQMIQTGLGDLGKKNMILNGRKVVKNWGIQVWILNIVYSILINLTEFLWTHIRAKKIF